MGLWFVEEVQAAVAAAVVRIARLVRVALVVVLLLLVLELVASLFVRAEVAASLQLGTYR
jgi:hypothetical protein